MPDGSGSRARIGVLTPHLDAVPESEFQALAPTGVSIHAARAPLGIVGPDGEVIPHVDAKIARDFAESPAVENAAALISAVNPSAVVCAFTSSSYILGADEDRKLKSRLEKRTKNIPVIIQSSALVTALKSLRAKQVSLVHPPWFSDDLDALGVAYFENQGIDVLEHGQAKIRADYGDMTPAQIFEWVTSHTPDNADAVVIGGGGFRAIGAIASMEASLGRPVLSANQAAFWLALRISGIEDVLAGYGQIFAEQLDE
jgi:maleate isomerase